MNPNLFVSSREESFHEFSTGYIVQKMTPGQMARIVDSLEQNFCTIKSMSTKDVRGVIFAKGKAWCWLVVSYRSKKLEIIVRTANGEGAQLAAETMLNAVVAAVLKIVPYED